MSRPSLIAATLAALVLAGPVGAATAQPTANQPPVATADEATVAAGQAVTVPVLANDTDDGLGRPEGEAPRLDVVAVTGDARATFTATDVTVTTGADDAGDIAVDYTVTDGELSATGRLTVHVAPAPARAVTIDLADRVVVLRDHPVTGAVQPATADVSVRVQRRTATGWTTYDRTTTDAQGGYAVTFRTARPGKVRLRALAVWPDGEAHDLGAGHPHRPGPRRRPRLRAARPRRRPVLLAARLPGLPRRPAQDPRQPLELLRRGQARRRGRPGRPHARDRQGAHRRLRPRLPHPPDHAGRPLLRRRPAHPERLRPGRHAGRQHLGLQLPPGHRQPLPHLPALLRQRHRHQHHREPLRHAAAPSTRPARGATSTAPPTAAA